MVHIALGFFLIHAIQGLNLTKRSQCYVGKNLGLASLEKSGAMGAGQKAHFGA